MSKNKINYSEGTLFAVPIAPDKYAVGLVARFSARAFVALGYFFSRIYDSPPSTEEMENLSPSDAVLVIQFGDYGLIKKLWPIIGQLEPWDRTQWSVPLFYRKDPLLEGGWVVEYADNDPTKFVKETRVSGNTGGLASDGSSGYRAVEERLFDLLTGNNR